MGERPITPTVKGPVGTTRPKSSVLPEGFSWLSVPIPKAVHAHARYMASLSNMSLKEYVAWFLRTARPCAEEDLLQDAPELIALSTSPDQDRSAPRSGDGAVLKSSNEPAREQPHDSSQH